MTTKTLDKRFIFLFIISSIIMITVVLAFTGGLNIASFQKNYTDSLVSSYAVGGGETVRKLEYAVKYGKPLTNFYGMEKLLQEKINDFPTLDEIQIALPNGQLVYNQKGVLEDRSYTPQLMEKVNFAQENAPSFISVVDAGKYHVFLPLRDRHNEWIGNVVLLFDEAVVRSLTEEYMWQLVNYLLISAVVAVLLLVLFTSRVPLVTETNQIRKKPILVFILVILGTVQLIYGVTNYYMFKEAYSNLAQQNATLTSQIIEKDIRSVIEKGVPYSQLYQLEEYLERIVAFVPEIGHISITNSNHEVMFQTTISTAENKIDAQNSMGMGYFADLPLDSTGAQGKINVTVSQDYLNQHMREIVLDMSTVLVTSFIFMVEVALFVVIFLRGRLTLQQRVATNVDEDATISLVRPVAFIFFISIFLSTSFIPIVMKRLFDPAWGLAESVVIALPVSVEMLCGGLATILAGYMIDKRGWRVVFFTGLLAFVLGTLLSGLAWHGLVFICARGVVGIGYGLALMALRGLVNNAPSETVRTSGVSALFAGLYAGTNCGVIVGAMLADRIGYTLVFFTAMTIALCAGLFAFIFIKKGSGKVSAQAAKQEAQARVESGKQIYSFFRNGKVLTFFILILIPTAACSMFLDYFFPVFAESINVSTSNVGRAFLLNGLCIVYLGPLLSKYTAKYLGVEKSIVTAGIIIVAALLFFASQGTLFAAFVAVILLGLADSFGLVAQNNYFLNLKASSDLGVGKALGFYGNIRKVGQMLGPMLFGMVAVIGFQGIGILAVVFLITIVVFRLSIRQKKGHVDHNTGVSM